MDSAPNRLLNLEELETPAFRDVLDRIDALLARGAGAYLHPSKRWEYPWALERAQLAAPGRLLDLGCGGSIFPMFLASAGHQVTAVDRTLVPGIDRNYGVRVDYVQAEMTRLPFTNAHFDAIFCISVIEHLGHAGAKVALAEMRRVLRPGGRLLLTTDYYQDAQAALRYEGPGESFPVDWGFFDDASLTHCILEAEGFHVEGEVDLSVDWPATQERMRRFHGYPYTSVGVTLVKGE